jgi:hypothetical protein
MKTTVHIPDTLLEEARKIANLEQTSIKALIEEGLRLTIESRKNKVKFRLRKATFKVNGLQPNVAGASWEKIRDMSYGGRGGRSLSTPTYWSTPTGIFHVFPVSACATR